MFHIRFIILFPVVLVIMSSCIMRQQDQVQKERISIETVQENEWEAKMAYLTQQIATAPTALNYYKRSHYLSILKRYEEALYNVDTAFIYLSPDDTTDLRLRLLYRRASCYKSLGNEMKTVETFKEIIAQYPNDDEAKESLAWSYFGQKRYKDAYESLPDSLSIEGKGLLKILNDI